MTIHIPLSFVVFVLVVVEFELKISFYTVHTQNKTKQNIGRYGTWIRSCLFSIMWPKFNIDTSITDWYVLMVDDLLFFLLIKNSCHNKINIGFIEFIVYPTMELCGDLIERVYEHLNSSSSSSSTSTTTTVTATATTMANRFAFNNCNKNQYWI